MAVKRGIPKWFPHKKDRKKKLNSIKLAEENFKPFGLLQTYCNFLIFNKADLDKFQRFCQGLCLELKIVFALILKVNAWITKNWIKTQDMT